MVTRCLRAPPAGERWTKWRLSRSTRAGKEPCPCVYRRRSPPPFGHEPHFRSCWRALLSPSRDLTPCALTSRLDPVHKKKKKEKKTSRELETRSFPFPRGAGRWRSGDVHPATAVQHNLARGDVRPRRWCATNLNHPPPGGGTSGRRSLSPPLWGLIGDDLECAIRSPSGCPFGRAKGGVVLRTAPCCPIASWSASPAATAREICRT